MIHNKGLRWKLLVSHSKLLTLNKIFLLSF